MGAVLIGRQPKSMLLHSLEPHSDYKSNFINIPNGPVQISVCRSTDSRKHIVDGKINQKSKQEAEYLRFRRPSRTLYTKSWNARSTAGLVGKCDNVFGWTGTICNLTAPPFLLSPNKLLLAQSSSTILCECRASIDFPPN